MDRRDFLTASRKREQKAETATYIASDRNITSGIAPYAGTFGINELVHLLKRTMFGSAVADINYFKTKTLSQAVDELLNPTAPLPSPPVNDYNTGNPDPVVAAGAPWVTNQTNDGGINASRRNSFKKWWMGVMINQDRSLREQMTLFWANHFSTEANDIGNAQYVYKHHNLLRTNALGNFKALVKAVTIDPGMLVYLNGYLNTASAPDENYGRELQELFTLGKGTGSQYTEDDVKKAAKVLTGWRLDSANISSLFDPNRHDTTNKQFSSFYNNTIITGRTGAAGATETDDLLNMIFAQNEVAKYFCRKLYQWFVYYDIDANTEANVIAPLAQIFRANNYEIKPVLSTLFKSEHFFDVLNQGCKIKSPVDFVVGLCREFNVVFPLNVPAEYLDAYNMWNFIHGYSSILTQNIGDPPSVSGWPAYYQVPQFYEIWINSDTLPKRNVFSDALVVNGYTRSGKTIKIDTIAFAKSLPNPADPNQLLDDTLNILFRVPLSAASKQQIKKQILLSNQDQDYYWSNAWNAYIITPNAANYNIVHPRLRDLLKYLMNLAEYQLA
jgi:uncharacterized protein (DUF1800 family)